MKAGNSGVIESGAWVLDAQLLGPSQQTDAGFRRRYARRRYFWGAEPWAEARGRFHCVATRRASAHSGATRREQGKGDGDIQWAVAQCLNALCAARPECKGLDDTVHLWNLRGHNADLSLLRRKLEEQLLRFSSPPERRLRKQLSTFNVDSALSFHHLTTTIGLRWTPSKIIKTCCKTLRAQWLRFGEPSRS